MKYFIIILAIIFIIRLKPLNLDDVDSLVDKQIKVEIKGHVKNAGLFEIDNYSTFEDLLKHLDLYEDSDYDHYALSQRLVNKQVISIKKKKAKEKISINSASAQELTSLKGIGKKMAERIILYRKENNGFKSLEDLKNVKGIGEKVFSNIKDFIIL